MRRWTMIYILAAALAANAGFACAAGSALTLAEAIARVLERNPQLQAADFDAQAAAEQIRQQAQASPYELGVELENVAGSGDISGVSGMETTLSLGRVLETGNKPHYRGEVAKLEAGILRHEQDALRLDLLAATAQHFLSLARVQAERELARERLELMQQTLEAVEQRHRIGKVPAAELSRVQIDVASAELALEETAHQLINGRRALSVMWGAFDPDFDSVQSDLFSLDAEPEFASLDRRIENNPSVAQLATQQRLASARLLLAEVGARPDPELRAGLRHLNESDDVGMVLSLRMPLGSAGRATPFVDEARARAAGGELLAQYRKLALRTTLSALFQEMLHARDRFEVYQGSIIPAAEKALQDYSAGYAVGRYSLLELTAARETLLEARLETLSSVVDHHTARIEIDRLVGTVPLEGQSAKGVYK